MSMSIYVSVNKDACIACGSGNAAVPEIFDLDYDGIAEVIYEGDKNLGITIISEDLQEELQEAVDDCPTQCIQLVQTPFAYT